MFAFWSFVTGDELHIEVEDEGGTLATPCATPAREDAEHGRGLLLVEALTTNWGVIPHSPEGRSVWGVVLLQAA